MFSRKARHIPWKKSLFAAVLLVASSATVAVAATSYTTIIGTPGPDTINKSGVVGDFAIFGLAGKDTLTGGKGDNLIVGDGHCPPGATDANYCDLEEIPGDTGDTLRGGNGDNAIFGGGGPNTMYGGPSNNYIESGPSTNVIYSGPLGDTINATDGSNTVFLGKGPNYVDARGPGIDRIYCTGTQDTVYVDGNDIVRNCANVVIGSREHKDLVTKRRATALRRTHVGTKHATRKHAKHPSQHR
jgi:Ca2+-binding RTX toxin-like protein